MRPSRSVLRPIARALCVSIAVSLLAFAGPPAAAQEPGPHEIAFRRAEIQARSLGEFERAAELYRESAKGAPTEAWRAKAELRAAACLVRAGQADAAQKLARPWAEGDAETVSAEIRTLAREVLATAGRNGGGGAVNAEGTPKAKPSAPTVAPGRVAALEEELEQTWLRLEQSLDQAAGARKENDDLAAEVRAMAHELDELRKRQPPPEPQTAEEALRARMEELEKERRKAQSSSHLWTRHAALLHQDGRFADAREFLYLALAQDPENAEAKALLARVAAPLGDREQLYLRIREVLALAREVRKARLTNETLYLVQRGRRLQERGDLTGSVAPLERALALVGSELVELRAPDRVREDVQVMLRRAEAAGAARAPVAAPDLERLDADAGWQDAVRSLLAAAGAEIESGLDLRFHDLDLLLPSAATLLPPAPLSDPPRGWSLSSQGPDAARLLTAWIAGAEARSLSAPRASIDVVGSTVVMVAESAAHARAQAQLSSSALAAAPASEIGLTVLRTSPGAWETKLAERGLVSRRLADGSRTTTLSSADVDALLGGRPDGVTARARFRAAHLQPFRLSGGAAGRSLTIDILAVTAGAPGVAVEVSSSWRPIGRSAAAPLTQRATAGAPLSRGGAIVVHGLTDPIDASRDLVVVVRLGKALETDFGITTAPDAELPPTRLSATEHLLPRSLARVQEINASILRLREHPIASRSAALDAWLKRTAPGATSLEVRGGRVLVVGDDATQTRVRAAIDNLARVRGAQSFRVEAFLLDAAGERRLIRDTPSLSAVEGASFASAVLPGARATAVRLLLATATQIDLTEPVLATPPTVRADAAHVVRTPYRRELDVAPGEATSWGRAETGYVDRGFLLALRPFGRDARERDELALSLRLVRVVSLPARERKTALGGVRLLEPHTEVIAGEMLVSLRPDDTLLVASLPSPFGGDSTRRMVILLSPRR